MEISTTLVGLAEMHPELEWQEIAASTAAVLEDGGLEAPYQVQLDLIDVPGFDSGRLSPFGDRWPLAAQRS